jgi:hypothetical protein
MLRSLAWSRDGREIWIATGPQFKGVTSIVAVDLHGRERTVLPTTGDVELADLAADGAGLLVRRELRTSMMVRAPGQADERDLSWLDATIVADLSADGRRVLLDEWGEGGGPNRTAYLRGTDGSPAVRLGEGVGDALSPDGQWIFWYPKQDPTKANLMPTGPGESRPVEAARIIQYRGGGVRWSRNGNQLVLSSGATRESMRLYVLDAALTGTARPLTPPGVGRGSFAVAPDGSAVAAGGRSGPLTVFPIGDGVPRPVAGAMPHEQALYWSREGTLYVADDSIFPLPVDAIDLATGRRRRWRTLAPADRAGVELVNDIAIAPEAGAYAYDFKRMLSDVCVVQGLK